MHYFIFSLFISLYGLCASSTEDVLERSTKFMVQKKRAQAIRVLSEALEKKDLKANQRKKITNAIQVASEMFFTDRGQSLFEAGRNLYLVSSQEAIKKMNEALELENENALVLWVLVKAELKEQQCERAKLDFDRLADPVQESKKLFPLLLSYCQKKPLEGSKWEVQPAFYGSFFRGLFLFWNKQTNEAKMELEKSLKLNPDFPETYYWLWKVDPQETEMALRYKKDCEAQKLQMAKKFEEFPQVCQFLEEISEENLGLENGET